MPVDVLAPSFNDDGSGRWRWRSHRRYRHVTPTILAFCRGVTWAYRDWSAATRAPQQPYIMKAIFTHEGAPPSLLRSDAQGDAVLIITAKRKE